MIIVTFYKMDAQIYTFKNLSSEIDIDNMREQKGEEK